MNELIPWPELDGEPASKEEVAAALVELHGKDLVTLRFEDGILYVGLTPDGQAACMINDALGWD